MVVINTIGSKMGERKSSLFFFVCFGFFFVAFQVLVCVKREINLTSENVPVSGISMFVQNKKDYEFMRNLKMEMINEEEEKQRVEEKNENEDFIKKGI